MKLKRLKILSKHFLTLLYRLLDGIITANILQTVLLLVLFNFNGHRYLLSEAKRKIYLPLDKEARPAVKEHYVSYPHSILIF